MMIFQIEFTGNNLFKRALIVNLIKIIKLIHNMLI